MSGNSGSALFQSNVENPSRKGLVSAESGKLKEKEKTREKELTLN